MRGKPNMYRWYAGETWEIFQRHNSPGEPKRDLIPRYSKEILARQL